MSSSTIKSMLGFLGVGVLLLGLSGVAQAKDLKNEDLSAEHGALATQIGDVPTNVEMTTQHGIITDDIAAALAALQADMATLQETVDALPAGAGPCEVPPVWGKTYATADRFVPVFGGAAFCDKATGLVWDGSPDPTIQVAWQTAVNHCTTRTVGGQQGFHLPLIEQLTSLLPLTPTDLNSATGDGPFTGVQSAGYWSATSYALNPTLAWIVGFSSGGVGINPKYGTFGGPPPSHAWCVRGGQAYDGQDVLNAAPAP